MFIKSYIILSILFSSLLVRAEDRNLELMMGSITYHLINFGDVPKNFTNKLSSDGRLISNFLIGVQLIREDQVYYDSIGVFTGQNSIGDTIGGVKWSSGIHYNKLYIGGVLGAYVQDNRKFEHDGIRPFYIDEVNGTGVVPVVGVEVNYKINLSNKTYIKFNNIISPLLTNSSLSLGGSF